MSWEMDVDGEPSGALAEMDDLGKITHFRMKVVASVETSSLIEEFWIVANIAVYGTAGAANEDVYSLTSGDDDWYMQEESSALSFPSYYIDAEAVVCLDGGGCKIRSGLVATEGDSTLDTSIACDSCDIWYHAICVGFNPETASENSWLCPRCMSAEVKQEADVILKQNSSEECVIGPDRTSTDASFSGRVSVSVADEGETALVVSMVGVHSEIRGGLSEASLVSKTTQEAFDSSSYTTYSKDASTDAGILRNTNSFSRSHNKPSDMNIVCSVSSEPTETLLEFSPIRESSTALFNSEQGIISSELLEVPNLVSSCSSVDNSKETKNTGEENVVHENNNQRSPENKNPQPSSSDAVQQMKTAQNMQLAPRNDMSSDAEEKKDMEPGNEVSRPAKKAKLEVQEDMNLTGNSSVSLAHSHATSSSGNVSDMSVSVPQHKVFPDIMSIVEGDDFRRDPGRELAKPVGRRAGEKPGLRVKKIFRKEGKESSVMVQKLQQEIRDVVRDTGTNILEKDGSFDEKLLTAFRAAIGKSVDGPAQSTNHSIIRTKRSLLQKGKKRENLTKRLYGTSTGRRRTAWHRDWEVEFWKYRCSPGMNPEKIETLQSVLQLLKKSSEMDKENAQGKKGENTDAILSRLYLADASVVPRKDDIKPLSSLTGSAALDKSASKPGSGTETTKVNSASSTGKVSSSSILNKERSSRREDPSQSQKGQPASDIKQDKRKWALEILARKNASTGTSKDQTGDTDALKGNFPLLAQLPVDMRPQLTAGRNNKVPVSVRQAQLHRIAEHYLQKTNLDVIRRCADTELAIADAVNVERDIYERSNSKLVYVNLCSQATRQPARAKSANDTSTLTEKTELGSDLVSQQVTSEKTNVSDCDMEGVLNGAVISDQMSEPGDDAELEKTVHKHTVSFSSAEEALKKAGLFDSPPNSPERETMVVEGECSQRGVVDLDSKPGKSLQSSPCSRASDVSPLKPGNSSVPNEFDAANSQDLQMPCQQPKTDPNEHEKLIPSGDTKNLTTNEMSSMTLTEADRSSLQCTKSSEPSKEMADHHSNMPNESTGLLENSRDVEVVAGTLPNQSPLGNVREVMSKPKNLEPGKEKSSCDNPSLKSRHPKGDKTTHPTESGEDSKKPTPHHAHKNTSDASISIYKKVEMFVKEHIRPLCKSGVITVDQYRWAVAKTTDKVMNFHRDAKNANFLIKEGDKVKRLALQYVEAAQQKVN
ncbi:hypothetical protein ACP4OV_024548 [Aristida adscensionis]